MLLSPVEEKDLLETVDWCDPIDPSSLENLERLNRNWRRLNELIFGHQDYAVVGMAPLRDDVDGGRRREGRFQLRRDR